MSYSPRSCHIKSFLDAKSLMDLGTGNNPAQAIRLLSLAPLSNRISIFLLSRHPPSQHLFFSLLHKGAGVMLSRFLPARC